MRALFIVVAYRYYNFFFRFILSGEYWLNVLAVNDGFKDVEDFFEWFNEDFEGQLIHWTDFKYLKASA